MMNGYEHLFELDDGGCRRFIPYVEMEKHTLGLSFRVHCSMPLAPSSRPRYEGIKVLSMQSLLSSAPDDQETIYYCSEDDELEETVAEDGQEEVEEDMAPSPPGISENGGHDVQEEEEDEQMSGGLAEEDEFSCPTCGREFDGFSACPVCSPDRAF